MKERKRAFRCRQGQAILELRSETDGIAEVAFSCIDRSRSGAARGSYCVPKADSKYVTCQTHECPGGYFPLGVHVKDTDSGREGFGFSCVEAAGKRSSGSLFDELVSATRFPG